MKMKSLFIIGLVVGIALLSSACSASKAVAVTGSEKDQVVATADPFAQDILNGITNNDFTTFAKDFDAAMTKAMTQSQFDAIVTSMAKLGAYKGYEVNTVESLDSYYRVTYKVTYEQGSFNMTLVIPQTGTAAVSGLWFK